MIEVLIVAVVAAWGLCSFSTLVAVGMVARNLQLTHKLSRLEHLCIATRTRADTAERAAEVWEDRALTAEAIVEDQLSQLTGEEP